MFSLKNGHKLFLILFALGCAASRQVSAVEKKSIGSFPLLGFCSQDNFYLPTFRRAIKKIPPSIYTLLDGNMEEAILRPKNSFIPRDKFTDPTGWTVSGAVGAYVYKTQGNLKSCEGEWLLVFDKPRAIESDDKSFRDQTTNTEWNLIELVNHKASHIILQTTEKGTCTKYLDYEFPSDFETIPDSDDDFRKARCGQQINLRDAHP